MAIDSLGLTGVPNCTQAAYLCKVGTHDKYENRTTFLHVFLNQRLHHANVFLSKQSVLSIQGMMWLQSTAAAANKNSHAKKVVCIWQKAL